MASVSSMLSAAGFTSIQSVHGETVTILTGTDAGKRFVAVILTQPSVDIDGEMGADMREKVIAHFPNNRCPALEKGAQFKDSDGQVWRTVKRIENPADTTTDFELVKISSKDK